MTNKYEPYGWPEGGDFAKATQAPRTPHAGRERAARNKAKACFKRWHAAPHGRLDVAIEDNTGSFWVGEMGSKRAIQGITQKSGRMRLMAVSIGNGWVCRDALPAGD